METNPFCFLRTAQIKSKMMMVLSTYQRQSNSRGDEFAIHMDATEIATLHMIDFP